MSKIFISYNPNEPNEQSIALRLQTLSSIYGVEILLPDRYGANYLKASTQERIGQSDLFILFSTRNITQMVLEEVNWALGRGKKVLIIYDKHIGKNLTTPQGVIEIEFDPYQDSPDGVLQTILDRAGIPRTSQAHKQTNEQAAIAGLLLLGLGLIILGAVSSKK